MDSKQKRYQRIAELGNRGAIEAPLLSEREKKYDPEATAADCLDDLRRVQAESPEAHITRRMYRDSGRYSDSTWDQHFGTFLEFRKQAGLELSRGQQQLERDIAKHSSLDRYRGFYESEVLPWAGRYSGSDCDAGGTGWNTRGDAGNHEGPGDSRLSVHTGRDARPTEGTERTCEIQTFREAGPVGQQGSLGGLAEQGDVEGEHRTGEVGVGGIGETKGGGGWALSSDRRGASSFRGGNENEQGLDRTDSGGSRPIEGGGPVEGSNPKRILVGSDFHDIESDPFVLSVFIATARRVQPDIIVLNGDVFDNYEFSRFDKDPRQCNLKERFEFVRDSIFAPLRNACPGAQIDLILGNHEHRIIKHFAERTPYMRVLLGDFMGLTFADLLGLPKFGINLVTRHDLAAFKVNAVRKEIQKNYKTYYGLFTVTHQGGIREYGTCGTNGHTHRPSFQVGANAVLGPIWWVNTGCIARVDAEYYDPITKATQSFLLVHIDTVKRECLPEHILFTDNMAIAGGVMYRRQEG